MNKRLFITALFCFYCFAFADGNIISNETYASFYGEPYNGRPTSSGEIFDMNAFTAAHKTLPFGTLVEVTNLENGRKVIVRINDRGPFVGNREIDLSKAAAEKLDMISQGITRVSLKRIDSGTNAAIVNAGNNMNEFKPENLNSYEVNMEGSNVYMPASEQSYNNNYSNGNGYNRNYSNREERNDAYSSATPYAGGGRQRNAAPKKPAVPRVYTPTTPEETSGPLWRIQVASFTREENALRLVVQLREIGFEPAYEKTETHVRVVLYGIRPFDLEKVKMVLDSNNFRNYVIRQESW